MNPAVLAQEFIDSFDAMTYEEREIKINIINELEYDHASIIVYVLMNAKENNIKSFLYESKSVQQFLDENEKVIMKRIDWNEPDYELIIKNNKIFLIQIRCDNQVPIDGRIKTIANKLNEMFGQKRIIYKNNLFDGEWTELAEGFESYAEDDIPTEQEATGFPHSVIL